MQNLILVMPVYNEADGLVFTLEDLQNSFPALKKLIIIDDSSTDDSREIALNYARTRNFPIEVYENQKNLGHGQSILKGLFDALKISKQSDFILTLDGDGQIPGKELRKLIEAQALSNADVVIGLRTQRTDLLYRRIITRIAIVSLFLISGVKSQDSNTPIRLWKSDTLLDALSKLPTVKLSVPNIHLTRIIANRAYKFVYSEILQHDRNGEKSVGVTWSNKWAYLPSRKLLRFSKSALKELWLYK